MYPDADIWLVGHSLGGSLASLLGATFGLPAVAFEAPGEKSAARHLHLPVPRELIDNAPVTHVYHNADPIPMGTCNGALSVCAQAGYALETKCHLGTQLLSSSSSIPMLMRSSQGRVSYTTPSVNLDGYLMFAIIQFERLSPRSSRLIACGVKNIEFHLLSLSPTATSVPFLLTS
jgi:putative hemolysin